MQALVYIFMALAGLAVAAAAYFGLTFTPIEAILTGVIAGLFAFILFEREMRRRAETRLEKGIEDLSRLLATDAQAGQVLSQRINEMADVHADRRLDNLEADVSVLGTVVRQVAEAVAEVEEGQQTVAAATIAAPAPSHHAPPAMPDEDDRIYAGARPPRMEPAEETGLPIGEVESALREDRLVFQVQPIISLPQRRTRGYDLLPRIERDNGDFVDATDFTPRKGGDRLLRQIEQAAWDEGFSMVRRARSAADPLFVVMPLSRAALSDPDMIERMAAKLEVNRSMTRDLCFSIAERQWRSFNAMERMALSTLIEKGISLSLTGAQTLKLDFSELKASGVTSVRVDATRFINQPEIFTDFHSADVAAYMSRFEIDLIVTNVRSEQQVLSLLEDGIRLIQGNHVGRAGPMPIGLVGQPLGDKLEQRVWAQS